MYIYHTDFQEKNESMIYLLRPSLRSPHSPLRTRLGQGRLFLLGFLRRPAGRADAIGQTGAVESA